MDRQIVYIGAIPQDTDILLTNRSAMISDGWAVQGILGTTTLFTGLACTPTAPATMTVNVGPGAVYSQQNVDNSAYGSLSADEAHQIMKIGINSASVNLACPAPPTSGQSVVYLVEAAFAETDGGTTTLPYYNAANPATPWSGPNNTGISQNTVRQDLCTIQIKAGIAATTGTQVTPAPDAGFTGLYAITVANSTTTITSGNIALVSGAPFISETLTQKISQTTADARYAKITAVQNNSLGFGVDSSGTANAVVVTVSPVPAALVQGMNITVTIANNNTGASTFNLNGFGTQSITINGNALTGGELRASQNALLSFNGTSWNLFSQSKSTTNVYSGTASTTGSANAQVLAAVTPGGFSLTYGNVVTFTAGASNTGATTINVVSTGVITIKKQSGSGLVDLVAGDIVNTDIYQIIYDGVYWELFSSSYPSPSTFFQVANNLSEGTAGTMRTNLGLGSVAVLSSSAVFQVANNLSEGTALTMQSNIGVSAPISGSRSGTVLVYASNSTVTITATEVTLRNVSSGATFKANNASLTLNTASSGVNGLDTGSLAANTWYYVFLIYNGTLTRSLMSLSPTAPTPPSGYTYIARIGCLQLDGSKNIKGFIQVGAKFQFKNGVNNPGLPVVASGVSGDPQAPIWTAVVVINGSIGVLPTTAFEARFTVQNNNTTAVRVVLAPNNSYGGFVDPTNAPPIALDSFGGAALSGTTEFLLESNSVYYASTCPDGAAHLLGFTDGL